MRTILDRILSRAHWTQRKVPHHLKKILAKNNACYILITCGKPSKNGDMQVEMSYEGDVFLASYLIENAQSVLDENISR